MITSQRAELPSKINIYYDTLTRLGPDHSDEHKYIPCKELSFVAGAPYLIAGPTLALLSNASLKDQRRALSLSVPVKKGRERYTPSPFPDGLRKLPGLQISLFAPSGKWMTLPSIVTVLPPS